MEIPALLFALLLIAFFSGIEIAFVSANRLRIELLKQKGSTRAKIISDFTHQPARFISTMLIGLNISLVLFSTVTANYFTDENFPLLPGGEIKQMLIQTLLTTVIILVFGELIPKFLFRINSDESLLWCAFPLKFLFYIPLKPLSALFHNISQWLIRSFTNVQIVETKQSFTSEDLEYLVKETALAADNGGEEADHLNSEIFEKALYLKEVKARNCMVPRNEIQAVEIGEGVEELKNKFMESKLSRLIIYEETIDRTLGYVHHYDMLKSPAEIKSIIRTLAAVPATMTARDLLLQFIRDRTNIAYVVDEYGGTAGIITMEDLMEEIFGEIQDEHDDEELIEKKISDNEFEFSGRLEIDYLNRAYNLQIPEDDYNTLSGYIISSNEDIPEPGTTIETDRFRIKILKASGIKIELVNLKVREEDR